MATNLIIMAYKTLEDFNNTGLIGILQADANAVPILPALILGALFIILTFSSYYATTRRFGRADFLASVCVSGLVTVVAAVLMSMIPNFMPLFNGANYYLIMTIILEIIFVLAWFFTGRES